MLQAILVLKKLYNSQGGILLNDLFRLDSYINRGSWEDIAFYEDKSIRIALTTSWGDPETNLDIVLFKENIADLDIRIRLVVEGIENTIRKTITLPYSQKQIANIIVREAGGAISANWDGFNTPFSALVLPKNKNNLKP